MYDWSEGGDVEVVVEDIERIDFEGYVYINFLRCKPKTMS